VHTRTAEVILISDAEHAIPVQSNRSGLRSIAVGTGDSDRLSLPFVTVESDLKAGDLLISTGMGGVFPSGYPVAEVARVERSPAATFAVVDARPTARLDRAREVLLVWFAPPPAPAADDAPAAGTGTEPATGGSPAPAGTTAAAATAAEPVTDTPSAASGTPTAAEPATDAPVTDAEAPSGSPPAEPPATEPPPEGAVP
jgi:rod shape-determining protein MreC